MTDSHTIQIAVDASSARSELSSLGQSIGGVASALKSIGASSGGSFDKLSRQISGLSSAFDQLRSVSGLGNVSREIRDLTAAIGTIRAPNQRAIDGITNLANAARHLGGVRVNQQLASDLAGISSAISRVRVSETSLNNIQHLATALSHLRVDTSVAGGLVGVGQALTNFRVSATAANNIERLASALSHVRIDSAAVGGLAGIGQALTNFRVSGAAASNIERLTGTLSRLRVDPNVSQALAGLGQSLSTIRISGAASNNLQRLAAALSQVRIDPAIASGLAGLGQATANLRGPTAGTVTNLQRLIQTLGSGNAGAVSAMARALGQLHNLNLRVPTPPAPPRQPPRQSSSGHGGGHGGNISVPGIPHLTGELRGLENAFSATYQAASLFRTAIGAITLGEFAHGIYEAGNDVMSFKIALDSVASDSGEAGRHFDYIKKTANELGGSLNEMIPAYQRLVASMRSLGYSEEDAQKTFRGAQAGLTANHAALIDQKRFMTELMETFAMGGGHATQVMRGMASHYPQLIGIMERVLKVNGEGLKKIFMEGGISAQGMIDIMQEVGRVSERGVAEALNHSMAQVNVFNNRFTEMKQKAFDGGFDSGLTTFLKEIGKAMDGAGFDKLGEKMGEGFRTAFAGATVFTKALIENRDVIYELLKAAVEIAVLYQIFKVASVGAALFGGVVTGVTTMIWGASTALAALASSANFTSIIAGFRAIGVAIAAAFAPSLALVAVITTITVVGGLIYATWEDINQAFGDGGPLLTMLQDAVKGLFDWAVSGLNYFLKTAAGVGSFLKTLWKTDGDFDASKKAFADAWASVGNNSADVWKSKAVSVAQAGVSAVSTGMDKIFDKMGAAFGKLGASGDFKKIYEEMQPQPLHSGEASDYERKLAEDLKRAAERAEELNHKVEKLFDKFLPDIKAAKELAGELRQIDEIQKKINEGIHPKISGMDVTQDTLNRLKDAVKEKALEKFDPTAIKIRDKIDELKAYQDFMGKGNKNDWAVEKEIITEKLALKKKGLEMTKEEEQAMRKLLALEKEMAKGGADGFTQWANSQKSAVDSMNDNIKSGMDSVADGIAKIATEGKGKFTSLGQAIRSEFADILRNIARNFISTGIRSLMSDAIKGMDIGGMKGKLADAIGTGDRAVASATSKMEDMLKSAAVMEVQAGVVNVNGATISGLGDAASSAEKALSGAATNVAGQTISTASSGVTEIGGVALAGLPLAGLAATAGKSDSTAQGVQQLQILQALSGVPAGSRILTESTQSASPSLSAISPSFVQAHSSGIDTIKAPANAAIDQEISTKAAQPSSQIDQYFGNSTPAPNDVLIGVTREKTQIEDFSGGKAYRLPEQLKVQPKVEPPKPSFETPDGIKDISAMSNYRAGQISSHDGFVFHHTGGRGTPESVVQTLNQRGLGVQYVMDREGQISRTLPQGAKGAHIRNSEINNLNNKNAEGMEVIAKDDSDVNAKQIASAKKFWTDYKKEHPNAEAFGHGELNSHKMKDEGKSIVDAIRGDKKPTLDPNYKPESIPLKERGFLTGYMGKDAAQAAATPTPAAELIARREGFIDKAKWDQNHYRVGYSSDTLTEANGKVREVQSGDTTTRADAMRDLQRRTNLLEKDTSKDVGDSWGKFSSNEKAALLSNRYNYGSWNKQDRLRNAVSRGDRNDITKALEEQKAHNGGINAGRRQEEADIFRGKVNPITGKRVSEDHVAPAHQTNVRVREQFRDRALDTPRTASLKPLSDSTQKVAKDFERNMNAASSKFAPEFTKDLSGSLKGGGGAGFGNVGSAIDSKPANDLSQQSADASGSLVNLGGSIANLATQSKAAPGAIMGVAQSIMSLIQQLMSSAGGGAGGGGGGLFGAIGGLLGGLFEEGGISGSAVTSATMPASFWAGAPAYAEGTPNTSGGMPAILHDNEAVIPLTRGREVPVQLNGAAGGGGDTHNHYHMNQNIQAKDHDSFRRNTNQMSAEFHKSAARMHVRNN